MKPPRIYVKPGETYKEARARWLWRFWDYKDERIMRELMLPYGTVKSKQFHRAFYGVEMQYVALQYLGAAA